MRSAPSRETTEFIVTTNAPFAPRGLGDRRPDSGRPVGHDDDPSVSGGHDRARWISRPSNSPASIHSASSCLNPK